MPPNTASPSSAAKATSDGVQDAVALLKSDHRKVEGLFAQYDGAGSTEEKHRLVQQVCKELIVHTLIEEEIFYPACRDKQVEDSILNEAQVEHDGAKTLISELIRGNPQDEYYDAKVKVLAAYIEHHVRDEEKPRSGIIAKAKAAGVDMAALGKKLEARKKELMADIREDRLEPPAPRAFHQPQRRSQEDFMARQSNYRERDERGRFIEDDDDDRRGGGSRGRDEEGRFTSGGSHGRYAARDDDERGRGRSGWYGDPEGHSQAARQRGSYSRSRYDEDDNGRGYGRSGWRGDSEGHSEASRRGWEHSSHEGSGWYGDPRGHAQASRRGWERSDHEGSGWYGDPEGHSRASHEGWDERGRSSSRSRDYDEDDDRRGRDHGGWYGDRRGHSEASRRGWEDR